jgi:hypothetical protein
MPKSTKAIVYEVLECDTIQELQKQVEARIHGLAATLVGGVSSVAVWQPRDPTDSDLSKGHVLQQFYQALTYETEDMQT